MISATMLGLTVQGSAGLGEEMVLCPFHNDSKASAWYSPFKGLFYCSVCGIGKNVKQLAAALGIDDLGELDDANSAPLPDFDLMVEPDDFALGEAYYHPYFQKRGISQTIASEYGLRWLSQTPQAAVLPITDFIGDTVGVCYRFLNVQESGTRYKFVGKTTPLWPMHKLLNLQWKETIVVTEGSFSALRINSYLEQFGLECNVFSLMGAKANKDIVEILRMINAIVLYDNDFAGRRACAKLRQLHPTVCAWTLKKSPDDMSDEEIAKLFKLISKKVPW